MNHSQDWVISGMSGRFPGAENVDIFWENLIQGKDMVSENTRWDTKFYQLPSRAGNIACLKKFDATFFGVSGTQANTMDPKTRIALEVVYEAIADAGLNHKSLDGDRVGVFMASSFSEAADIWLRSHEIPTGYYVTGCHPCMLADRISYVFNFKGPSCVFDSACSASFSALQYAILALKSGMCDSAIVGGANINLSPLISQAFGQLNLVSADGKCKVFDADCDGYVRSEAVVALYICRKDRAKRSYATIAGIKCGNAGYKPEGISVPSAQRQEQLMKEVYADAKKNPLEVYYVEAHGTGTKVGDPMETAALDAVFCKGRNEPLLVGSIKTNIGHAEAAAGLCGIIKVLVSRRAGVFPPNLHFKTPNPECHALIEGRIQIVTKATTFKGSLVGINCLGIGGTLAHIILEFDLQRELASIINNSDNSRITTDMQGWRSGICFTSAAIPTLLPASGRTNEAVDYFLNEAMKNSHNKDFVGLLQNIVRSVVPRHEFAGYALIKPSGEFEIISQKQQETLVSTWYVYTGLGSQWLGMMQQMSKFKIFESSLNVSSQLMKKYGVDLESIFQTQDLRYLNNLQNSFVAIVACQIALTDLLKSLDIFPNGIIGHSLGEVTCGYTDGCLQHEQTIGASFCRAKSFLNSNLPPGTMASVGLSWDEALQRCPSDVFRAINNTQNNISVGGPKDSIHKFVNALTSEGIFAKEVKSANFAFHTPYVRGSEQLMLTMLKEVIPENTRRSNKWLSTSVPVVDWDSDLSKHCSAEYLVNNALSPVLLFEVLQHVPKDSLVVEIGPHCFLQSVIKQSLKYNAVVTGLMHCKHDNTLYFLHSIGRIFLSGCHLNITALYNPLKYPILGKTPSISPLIKWDHSVDWDVPRQKNEIYMGVETKLSINLTSDEAFSGHVLKERIIFPATGYIWLVWKTFARLHSANPEEFPIHLENINFKRITELFPKNKTDFNINILKQSGDFEIVESSEIVCNGTIRQANKANREMLVTTPFENENEETFDLQDFYRFLHLKGYSYKGLFRGVQNIEFDGKWAKLAWNENWICFLDAMLQTWILGLGSFWNELAIPVRLQAATIDPILFRKTLTTDTSTVVIKYCKYTQVVQCPGIRLGGLITSAILLHKSPILPTITVQKFSPYIYSHPATVSKEAALEFFIGIVVDNSYGVSKDPFVFTEILTECKPTELNLQSLLYLKFLSFEHRVVQTKRYKHIEEEATLTNCQHFESIKEMELLAPNHLIKTESEGDIPACAEMLVNNGFIILCTLNEDISTSIHIISKRRTERQYMYLLRKVSFSPLEFTIVSIDGPDFDWVEVLKEKLESIKIGSRVHILSITPKSGIIGFTKCLFKEPGCENARCIYITDTTNFNPNKQFLITNDILKKDLVFNVFANDIWGSYSYITVTDIGKSIYSEHVYGNVRIVGDLSSLSWVESSCKLYQRDVYRVHYASLNFRDVMIATGKLSRSAFSEDVRRNDSILGMEFSGTYRGRRVFGISSGKCLTSCLDHNPAMVWDVPDPWSLAQAATVPIVYATVLYSLLMRGKLREGETILIHSGSGAVGLAAITIALDLNCKIFTTVGSHQKRKFLMDRFPQLGEERILDTENETRFKEEIMRQTKGEGLNMVLNSLAEAKLKASLDCLGNGGRFLEIGKSDSFANHAVGMGVLLKGVTIHGILLDKIMVIDSTEKRQLQTLLQAYMEQGKIQPLPFTCFNPEKLEDAFRYLSSRNHIGKVIIEVRNITGTSQIDAIPRTYFYPHKTYIIIGGLGGMGLEIVSWMINRGARQLFIVSRSGVSTSYQKYMVKSWNDLGTNIVFRNTNVSIRTEVFKLMAEAISIGPLGGVFNLAIVLQDGLFINQSAKSFSTVSSCKASATVHFDVLSRKHAPYLDYFVVFSSVSCGRGNVGQTNYGYANSVMERICEQRKTDGLPALAIQYGPVADVGSFGKFFRGETTIQGAVGQQISSCIDTLDLLLQQTEPVVSSFLLPSETGIASNISKEISLLETVAGILGIQDIEKVDINTSMTDLGLDSMMAVEFKHAIHRKKNIFLPTSAYGNLTLKDFIDME